MCVIIRLCPFFLLFFFFLQRNARLGAKWKLLWNVRLRFTTDAKKDSLENKVLLDGLSAYTDAYALSSLSVDRRDPRPWPVFEGTHSLSRPRDTSANACLNNQSPHGRSPCWHFILANLHVQRYCVPQPCTVYQRKTNRTKRIVSILKKEKKERKDKHLYICK